MAAEPSNEFKRKRAGSIDPQSSSEYKRSRTAEITGSELHHDDEFYFEDGSCILRVEDTLFNVHKTVLSRENSFFRSMFKFPTGENEVGMGGDDDNPVMLTGDKPSELRNFFWALYALPPELQSISSPDADLSRMIDIARISNKYSFRSLESWVLTVIHTHVSRRPSPLVTSIDPDEYTFSKIFPPDPIGSPGTHQLVRLMRLAHMCNHDQLMGTIINIFKQIMSGSLEHAYLAMALADELDIKDLRGQAYLEVMRKAPIVKASRADRIIKTKKSSSSQDAANPTTSLVSRDTSPSPSDIEDSEQQLIVNPSQQLRLLSGYYRLSRTWDKLRVNPPHFDHAPSCSATWHQHGCTQAWVEFWKEKTRSEAMMGLGLADVVGRIRQIQADYNRWGTATYMHLDCRSAARRSLEEIAKKIEEALPDYFSHGAELG